MLEVEVKYRLHDAGEFEQRLRAAGATFLHEQEEVDHYLTGADRDFARTDEALRLRRTGDQNTLTYKGPRRDATTKTRREIEASVAPGPESASAILAVLENIGHRPVAVVRKHRRLFEWPREGLPLHVCIDSVDAVGTYAELESVVAEDREAEAKAALAGAAAELGLTHSETRSYLEQLLGRAVRPGGE